MIEFYSLVFCAQYLLHTHYNLCSVPFLLFFSLLSLLSFSAFYDYYYYYFFFGGGDFLGRRSDNASCPLL